MGGKGISDSVGRSGVHAPLSCPVPDPVLADHAANALDRHSPGLSARQTLSPAQRRIGVRLIAMLGVTGLAQPDALVVLCLLLVPPLFAAIILFRLFLLMIARWPVKRPEGEGAATPLLPFYTILVALKDEAAVMPQLAGAMAALDYPEAMIDLKLLVEAGDASTRTAIEAERWPAGTELLVVPPGKPQTKPRALNYGLARARGTYVVVYDAEDLPDPGQLKAAIDVFNRAGPETVCLQAPLVGAPARGGWLARRWALEYAIQFGLIVPALARLGLPIALGGTSNHFRRTALVAAGGWDAWNVTEDADLGLRLARLGHRVGAIASPTREAPPEAGGVWLAQRSRWLKGYVQTWCVLMRRKKDTGADSLRPAAHASVQLTLGAAILSALVHGPWALWCAACLFNPSLTLGPFGTGALILALLTGLLSAGLAPGRAGWRRGLDILTLPLYWPLQTIAMARALWSLVRTPHYWAKTPHL